MTLFEKLWEVFSGHKTPKETPIEYGPNLDDATLFLDGDRGIYLPQHFAEIVDRSKVEGVAEKDWKVLEAGPDHEHYWDAWADVCDNAIYHSNAIGKCYLLQDGDLWLVPCKD